MARVKKLADIDLAPILALPAKDRKMIAQRILESTKEPPIEIDDELWAELKRRMAHSDAHPEEDIPYDQFKKEMRQFMKQVVKKRA